MVNHRILILILLFLILIWLSQISFVSSQIFDLCRNINRRTITYLKNGEIQKLVTLYETCENKRKLITNTLFSILEDNSLFSILFRDRGPVKRRNAIVTLGYIYEKLPEEERKKFISLVSKIIKEEKDETVIEGAVSAIGKVFIDFKRKKAEEKNIETEKLIEKLIFETIENKKLDENTRFLLLMRIGTKIKNADKYGLNDIEFFKKFFEVVLKIIKDKEETERMRIHAIDTASSLSIPSLSNDKEIKTTLENIFKDENEPPEISAVAGRVLYFKKYINEIELKSMIENLLDQWEKYNEIKKINRTLYLIYYMDYINDLSTASKKEIGKKAAIVINKVIEKEKEKRDKIIKTGLLINYFSNVDEKNIIRKEIVENLLLESKYYLIAIASRNLYTSTFFMLYEGFKTGGKIIPQIKAIDPEGKYHKEFILTLFSFREYQKILEEDPEFLVGKIKEILELKNKKEIKNNGALVEAPIRTILKEKKEVKFSLQETLLYLYKRYKEGYEMTKNWKEKYLKEMRKEYCEGMAVIGYLIKSNINFFDISKDEHKKILDEINQNFPEFLKPEVPTTWFEDNKITAELYFYSPETSFESTVDYFGKTIGIKKIDYTKEGKIIIPITPNIEILFEKKELQEVTIDKNTLIIDLNKLKKVELKIRDTPHKIIFLKNASFEKGPTVIKKRINDIEIEIILVKRKDPAELGEERKKMKAEVISSLENKSIDIIAHRGHSYYLSYTFPQEKKKIDCKRKLLYLGSCGSFGDLSHFENYSNCYYISDANIANCADNNFVLGNLLHLIATGKRDWEEIKKEIERKGGGKLGIVYPHEEGILYYDSLKTILEKIC